MNILTQLFQAYLLGVDNGGVDGVWSVGEVVAFGSHSVEEGNSPLVGEDSLLGLPALLDKHQVEDKDHWVAVHLGVVVHVVHKLGCMGAETLNKVVVPQTL